MGLPPSEFERLTYAELRFYLEGCETKLKRESEARLDHNAWLAATLINWLGTYKETISAGGAARPATDRAEEIPR